MLTNSTIKKLALIYEELKTGDSAVLSEDDLTILEFMVAEGYTTNRIREIINSKSIKDDIKNNKVYSVFFDEESKEQIKLCIENKGKMQGAVVAVSEKVPAENFIACTFAEGEIAGVMLLDNYNVVIIRKGIASPLSVTMQDANAAKTLFDKLSELV